MPSLPKPVKKGANVAAGVLETTAGLLRHVSGGSHPGPEQPEREREQPPAGEQEPQAKKEPAAQAAPAKPSPAPSTRGTKPAAATRQRISNPKAAKRVRARES